MIAEILKLYLKDIYNKNKTENLKTLNDNTFFILLGTMEEYKTVSSDYLVTIFPEILKHLSEVPSMKSSFQKFYPSFNEDKELNTFAQEDEIPVVTENLST